MLLGNNNHALILTKFLYLPRMLFSAKKLGIIKEGIYTGKVETWPEKMGLVEAAKTNHKIPNGSASTGCGLNWGQCGNM